MVADQWLGTEVEEEDQGGIVDIAHKLLDT
jgi:hypothetical protein